MEHYHQILPEKIVDKGRTVLEALGQLVLPKIHWNAYNVEKPVTEPRMTPQEALAAADDLHDQGRYEAAQLLYESYIYGEE